MFLNGAPTFAGGFAIFGSNDTGDRFSYTVIDDSVIPSMDLPNGNWSFWAIGWDNANKLEGTTKCGASTAVLQGGDIAVGMTLSIANCGTSGFAAPPFINTNQFHPVVVTSCYNATVTDATSTCDASFKGEHRSFRFVLDTISNFGPLPNPQPIVSNCFNETNATTGSSTTTVTLPSGMASNGPPLNVRIEAFPSTGCTGAPVFFNMPNGFYGPIAQAQTYAGASQTKVYLTSLLPTAGPINSIYYDNLSATGITSAFVNISFDFLDDDDADSSATLQTCNITVSGAGCVVAGSTALTKGTTTYDLSSFSHGGSPGDEIKYNVTVTDPDGVSAALPDQTFFVPVQQPTSIDFNSPATSPGNVASPIFNVNGTIASGSVSLHTLADCSDAAVGSAAGAASFTSVPVSGLSDGTHTFYAKQTINGVDSPCSSGNITYILDTLAPAAPTSPSMIGTSPTLDSTPDFMASGLEVGTNVNFYSEGTCSTLLSGPHLVTSGTDTWTISPLTDGTYNIFMNAYDAAGNTSSCTAVVTVTVDTVIPATPSGLTGPGTDTNDNTPDITVTHTAETGTIYLYSDASCTILKGSAPTTGTTSTVTSSTLTDGAYTFYAKHEDSAGNSSVCSSASTTVNIDTIAPNIISITRVDSSPTTSGTKNYSVTFSEPILGMPVSGDFVLTTVSGGTTNAIGTVSGGPTNFNVSFTVSGGDGELRLDLNDSDFTIADLAGNQLAGNTFSSGEVYMFDNTGPQFVSISGIDGVYYEGEDVDITVTFNEVTFATGTTLNLSGGYSAAYFSGNGTPNIVYRFTVGALDNFDDLDYSSSIPISAGSIQDILGNTSGSVVFPTPGSVGSLANGFDVDVLGSVRYQFGGTGDESKVLIARDDLFGDVFMAVESTDISFYGSNMGGTDIVVFKFDMFGNIIQNDQIAGTGNEK